MNLNWHNIQIDTTIKKTLLLSPSLRITDLILTWALTWIWIWERQVADVHFLKPYKIDTFTAYTFYSQTHVLDTEKKENGLNF